jgi:hypothetical protein
MKRESNPIRPSWNERTTRNPSSPSLISSPTGHRSAAPQSRAAAPWPVWHSLAIPMPKLRLNESYAKRRWWRTRREAPYQLLGHRNARPRLSAGLWRQREIPAALVADSEWYSHDSTPLVCRRPRARHWRFMSTAARSSPLPCSGTPSTAAPSPLCKTLRRRAKR